MADQRLCPDQGTCHHDCTPDDCYRVRTCAPLSGYGEDWTAEDKATFGHSTDDGNPYGDYAFACTYWRYCSKFVEFGDDLEELVLQAVRAEDDGEQSTEGFWQAVGSGWAAVDVDAIWEKIMVEEVAEAEQRNSDRETKPWIVTIYGPGDASSFESSHATAEEAAEAVKKYPAHVRPTVTKR